MNQILCSFAKKKNIGFIFSLNFLNKLDKYLQSKEIGRINQNIILARKFKIPINISFIIEQKSDLRTINQIEEIYKIFKISTNDIKNISNSLVNKIDNNNEKKHKKYINEFIKFKK